MFIEVLLVDMQKAPKGLARRGGGLASIFNPNHASYGRSWLTAYSFQGFP
jgi:hypothetical protein